MLIDFTVGNFRSFGEKQTLSMIASNDPLMASHVISDERLLKRKKIKLLRNVVIYGANASGKSNLCAAVRCMSWLVAFSATKLNFGDEIPNMVPFRLKSEFESKPCFFEVRVLIDGSVFRYGFEATRQQICREWLFVTGSASRSKEILLFDREGLDSSLWRFGPSLKGRTPILMTETRESNCLLLSKSAQNNFPQTRGLYEWFSRPLLLHEGSTSTESLQFFILATLQGRPVSLLSPEFIARVMRVADSGVSDVHVDFGPPKLRDNPRPEFGGMSREETYKLKFFRGSDSSSGPKSFDIEDESSGTRRFLEIASLVEIGSGSAGLLIIDELESSLHPLLTRALVDVMNEPDLGLGTAQFIVTTHDSNLLDRDLLRRDQIWFTQKGVDNQTELFSLYDLKEKPKPDAALERQYLASRFGGVPTIGNLRLVIANGIEEFNERVKTAVRAPK